MLYNFAYHHPDGEMVKGATIFVSGISKYDKSGMIHVKIIRKEDFQKISTHYSKIISVHVYSVQKSAVLNMNVLQEIAKGTSLTDRLNQIPFMSIVNPKSVVEHDIHDVVPPPVVPAVEEVVQNADMTQLIEKYRPKLSTAIIGQQVEKSARNQLTKWLKYWNEKHGKMSSGRLISKNIKDHGAGFKCALISGPPGVGKTITACLVSKESGFDLIEYNASDTRSKKYMREIISNSMSTNSVVSGRSKRLILMDEIDGMIGDRGGLQELIDLIKKTRVPVICICNDRNNEKIQNLANYCFDLRISKPRIDQLKKTLTPVCSMEAIPINPDALLEVIAGCQQDVRQILNNLSMMRADDRDFSLDRARKEVERIRKTSVRMNPWEVCKMVFDRASHKSMSFNEKSDLFFHNRELAGMFVQENYVKARPVASDGSKTRLMTLLSRAADSISLGEIFENEVRKNMNCGLLPTAAAFCSVLPGSFLSGLIFIYPTLTDIIAFVQDFLVDKFSFLTGLLITARG